MAAEAKVILTAQDATTAAFRNVNRNLDGMKRQVDGASAQLRSMFSQLGIGLTAGAAFSGLTRFIDNTVKLADELGNTAAQTGMTVEQLSALKFAASQADVEFSALSGALTKFQRNIAEAGAGNKQAQNAFLQLGISMEQVQSLKTEDLFLLVAQRISELSSEAQRTKAEIDAFGRSGAELDPLLRKGASGIREGTAAAKEFGAVVGTETNERVRELGDKVEAMRTRWQALSLELVSRSAPALSEVAAQIERIMNAGRDPKSISRALVSGPLIALTRLASGEAEKAAAVRSFGPTTRGRRGGNRSLIDPEAEAEAAKKAKKAAEEYQAYWENVRLEMIRFDRSFMADIERNGEQFLEDTINGIERENEARREARDNYAEWLKDQQRGTSQLSEFAAQAARNMQDAFAQFLFDPFKGGLKGMLAGFVDMLRQMVAQIAAQAILNKFFAWMAGGEGVIGTLGKALQAGLKGMANGGSVSGRTPYIVGERGPELFVPSTSGTIVPNHRMGGGVTLAPVYNVDARGASADLVKSLPAILEANTRRAVELARATIYDDYSRGAFGRA